MSLVHTASSRPRSTCRFTRSGGKSASWSPDRGDTREHTRADSRNPHACHGRCHGCDVHREAIGVQARRRPSATRRCRPTPGGTPRSAACTAVAGRLPRRRFSPVPGLAPPARNRTLGTFNRHAIRSIWKSARLPRPATRIAPLWWVAPEVRRYFSQEQHILLKVRHSCAQLL